MSTGLTIIEQGSFKSNGNAHNLNIPMGVDWIWVQNQTAQYAAGSGLGVEYYWDTTMPQGQGTKYVKEATIGAMVVSQLAAGTGFYILDQEGNPLLAPVATTAISGANPPVVSTGSTAGLATGSIVRLTNTVGALQLSSVDFTVESVVTNTSFALAYMQPIVATASAGQYSIVQWDTPWYPKWRYISKILLTGGSVGGGGTLGAGLTRITFTVTHSLTVGQQVRFIVPQVKAGVSFGTVQLNGLTGNIVAINANDADSDTNTIDVDIDSTGFTAFAWPLTANVPFTYAIAVPLGENTSVSLSGGENLVTPNQAQIAYDFNGVQLPGTQTGILADAMTNVALRGITLMPGTLGPAGANNDFIDWMAGVSFSINPNS